MIRAVFLDLNGTLVTPVKVDHPSDLREFPGAAEAVRRLSLAGYVCPVVTIQSRIGKGLFSEHNFMSWFRQLQSSFAQRGAHLLGPYVCPHPFETDCPCKKPQPFLYRQAARDHNIDLANSYVIGDTAADVEAAARFGGKGILVRTGYAESDDEVANALPHASFIGRDLGSCADSILHLQ